MLLVPIVLGLCCPAAVQAKPAAQIIDRRGDAPFAGSDILGGRVSSARAGGRPVLQVELQLAAAPPTGIVMEYNLDFIVGCTRYAFQYVWAGAADQSIARIDERGDMCRMVTEGRRPTTVVMADTVYDVTLSLKGSTLVWETPYVGEIKAGATAFNFFSEASVAWLGGEAAAVGSNVLPGIVVGAGDAGRRFGNRTYVIGSDLR
jgi:hypothetical protein